MSCAQWEERIAEEIGGQFSTPVEEHLRQCAACKTLAEELESDRLTLAAAPPDADADYTAMRRAIRTAIVRQQRVRRYVPALLAAAALVVALVLVRPRAPVQTSTNAPIASQPDARLSPTPPSKHTRPRPVPERRSILQTIAPPVDLALLRKVTGQEPAPETGSESAVEMQIATANPNVTIILLQAKDVSYE